MPRRCIWVVPPPIVNMRASRAMRSTSGASSRCRRHHGAVGGENAGFGGEGLGDLVA